MEKAGRGSEVQIFGTDISDGAIEAARQGKYPGGISTSIAPERLERFFVRTEGGFQIARRIREMCIFSRQDVTRDPPLAKMDLISCRNLLIYLDAVLQRRVIAIFDYALKPGGFLLLGNSESISSLSTHFLPVDATSKLYRRDLEIAPPRLPNLPAATLRLPLLARPPQLPRALESSALDRMTDHLLAQEYAPAGFLLDSERHVIKFRGNVGEYLLMETPKTAHSDLTGLLRPEFLEALNPPLAEAMAGGAVARRHFKPAQDRDVEIIVLPVAEPRLGWHYLVILEEAPHRERRESVAETNKSSGEEQGRSAGDLALDLASTRAYLQRLVEDLRAANEEAQSSNEELQSTNEELQTAKEELQSSNEELATTNEEMQSRNGELGIVNADLVNLLSSLQVAILMLDRDLRVRRYTPVCEKLFNLIPSDVGRPITDLRASVTVPNLKEALQGVIASGEAFTQEVSDSEGHWYSLRVQPYRTTDKRIGGVVLQLFDIDILKRTMQQVEKARDYADAIVGTVSESLAVLDSALLVLTVNQSFCSTFGTTQEECAGNPIYELGNGRWDAPQVHGLLDGVLAGVAQPPDVEMEQSATAGPRRTLSLSARRIGFDTAGRSILLAVQDITDRKLAAEARYRRLFETAKDAIVMIEAVNGIVTDVNPRAIFLLGRDREEMVGRRFWEVPPLAAGEADGELILERLRGNEMVRYEAEYNVEGASRSIEILANLYREGERQVIQFNVRDITQRRQFEQQLQQTAKLESLGILAGGIAHDFNNLLAGILGNASLALLESTGPVLYQNALQEVVRASQRAAELTSQMLAYAGKGRYVVRAVDFSELVRDISALVLTSIPKTVKVDMKLAQGLPAVEADVSQLQQVIMNLVINGAESVEEGRLGFLHISTALVQFDPAQYHVRVATEGLKPGPFVMLEVRDSGSGMDESVLSRIFDPFFTTKFTGRGLGLAAVQGIVRSHGGALAVDSQPGRGTTFQVFLPAIRRIQEDIKNVTALGDLHGKGTILVVDDEEAVASMASAILESHGYRALVAGTGRAAIEILKRPGMAVSAVVLDLTMPDMGGKETLVALRKLSPSLPVILSTGYDSSRAEESLDGAKVFAVLQKPYTAQQLLVVVRNALHVIV